MLGWVGIYSCDDVIKWRHFPTSSYIAFRRDVHYWHYAKNCMAAGVLIGWMCPVWCFGFFQHFGKKTRKRANPRMDHELNTNKSCSFFFSNIAVTVINNNKQDICVCFYSDQFNSYIFRKYVSNNRCIDYFTMTSSNGSIFRVTGPLCGEFTGHRWFPLTMASDADLWCFLWSAPE